MMRPEPDPVHFSLGYAGKGTYRCSCGEEFHTPTERPLQQGPGDAGFAALKDQWNAHRAAARQ